MTDDERRQRLERLKALRDRIAILLLRQAQLGPQLPSALALELQEARHDEAALVAELGLDTALPERVGSQALAERVLALEFRFKLLDQLVGDAMTAINAQLAQIRDDSADWRSGERAERHERQRAFDDTLMRIQFAIVGLALGFAALAGYLVTR